MAKSSTASLARLIKQLLAERQKHADAIEVIDEQFEAFGIVAAAPSKKKKRRGRKPGRPRGAKKKASKKRGSKKKISKTPSTKKATKKKRRTFRQTAEEFVLGLLKGRRKMTTAQINAKWKQAGRGASANVTLGKLVNEKKLKRENIEGERGSQYLLATGGGKKKSTKKKTSKKKVAKRSGKKKSAKKTSKKKAAKKSTEKRSTKKVSKKKSTKKRSTKTKVATKTSAAAPPQGEKKPTG